MTSSNGNIFRVTDPLCGEFTGPGEFPAQRPVTRSFDVFFDLHLNKRLSKQPWGWWFEAPSWSLWRHCNDERRLKWISSMRESLLREEFVYVTSSLIRDCDCPCIVIALRSPGCILLLYRVCSNKHFRGSVVVCFIIATLSGYGKYMLHVICYSYHSRLLHWQRSNRNCPGASEATLKDMGKIGNTWQQSGSVSLHMYFLRRT